MVCYSAGANWYSMQNQFLLFAAKRVVIIIKLNFFFISKIYLGQKLDSENSIMGKHNISICLDFLD